MFCLFNQFIIIFSLQLQVICAYKVKDIEEHRLNPNLNATRTSIEKYLTPALVIDSGDKTPNEITSAETSTSSDAKMPRELVYTVAKDEEGQVVDGEEEEYYGVLMNNPLVIYMNLFSIVITPLLFIYHLFTIIRKTEEPKESYG